MLKNYVKVAFRNIVNGASYTIINVSGLTLGISCALLIFSLVTFHLSFDNFHPGAGRIYRFVTEEQRDEIGFNGSVPPGLGKAFRDEYTFGEKVAKVFTHHESLITFHSDGDLNKFKETIVSFAEPEFFEIFNFPLVSGNSQMLVEPNNAIITESIARKYFGEDSALDKVLRFENLIDFKIVGVLRDIPENTDFRSEIYFSFSSLKDYSSWAAADDSWGGITSELQTFTRLHAGVDPTEVETSLTGLVRKYRPKSTNIHRYKLQPLDEKHFDSRYGAVMNKTALLVLAAIGFFLILTACLNFINLATAQALTRSKEVGVRKTLGSARSQLFWQFSMETFVIVLISGILGFVLAYAAVPFVNDLFNARIRFDLMSNFQLWIFMPLLLIVVTFLSCSYPGIVLSRFKPVVALKGKPASQGSGNFNLRRSLITAQFAIAQVLLIGLIVIAYQMRYFSNTDMGYSREGIVLIPLGSRDEKMKTVKERFASIPQVASVSTCFSPPASNSSWNTSLKFDNRTENEIFSVSLRAADENYLNTFDIPLIAGRNLLPSDTVREFLVNETFLSKLMLASPQEILGKTMTVNGSWTGPVVGVVRDFHDQSLHSDIRPVFLTTVKDTYWYFAVKINLADSRATLASLEKIWSETYPELLYEYDFVDTITAEFYETEETMLQLVQAFSLIALAIGCMGLYGLVSFVAVQKTKEIGIRKVLGGSVAHILWIFGREFSILIVVAFAIAAPVAWWLMSTWLETFAYQIDFAAWIFILELLIVSAIGLLTVGFRSLRAALMNPVAALRTE